MVIFLTYFLMLSGDTFRRKMLKLAGPSLSSKKITLQALHEITGQIQRYLQVQLLTSALVGVLTWLALLGHRAGKRGGLGHCGRRAQPGALCRAR